MADMTVWVGVAGGVFLILYGLYSAVYPYQVANFFAARGIEQSMSEIVPAELSVVEARFAGMFSVLIDTIALGVSL